MKIKPIESIESEDQAREEAISWQHWHSEQSLSYGEMSEWQEYFEALAERWPDLTDEFSENGII
jgi:hypothetical protein